MRTLIIILLLVKPVYADEKKIADIISYGTVVTQITLNTIHSWKEPDRKRALVMEGTRDAIVVATSEIVKRLVHEERPDHSDNLSFWSEHSALAAVNMRYNRGIGISLTIGTASGRIIAKKHNWWDTLAGIGVGVLTEKLVK